MVQERLCILSRDMEDILKKTSMEPLEMKTTMSGTKTHWMV